MPWVESVSRSFRARHDSAHVDDADAVLGSLERTRDRLDEVFPRTLAGITVVLHTGTISLSLSNPIVPLAWITTAPATRRYIAGWTSETEIHVLAPAALKARASNVTGSREMLALTAPALYTRRVIAENNHDIHQARAPTRLALELRWAWLLEGAARWFSGQTDYARAAIARRLRDGGRPRFPPSRRDAPLLGGTVIDLLAREQGELAAAQFACHLHPHGARAALAKAFPGRTLKQTEGTWRNHLARLSGTG